METTAVPMPEADRSLSDRRALEADRADFSTFVSASIAHSLPGRWWSAWQRLAGALLRQPRPASLWLAAGLVALITILLGLLSSLLFQENAALEPVPFLRYIAFWALYTPGFCGITHFFLERFASRLGSEIAAGIPSPQDLAALKHTLQTLNREGWQLGFCLGLGPAIGIWASWSVSTNRGLPFQVGQSLVYAFNFFQIFMYLFFLFLFILIFLRLSRMEFDLFDLDPAGSPVLQELYHAARNFTLIVAVHLALFAFLTAWILPSNTAAVSLPLQIVLGFLPTLTLFITTHYSMARIISRAKRRKLEAVQRVITAQEQALASTSQAYSDELWHLLSYYMELKSTPNTMLNGNAVLNLLGSLLLPLLALVLGNFGLILNLIRGTPVP
jgi:hypothetical protein